MTGENAVRMGAAVMDKITTLESMKPKGLQVNIINFQAARVTWSLDGFMVNLAEAVAIVVLLLLFFMGLRSGLLIGTVLVLTTLGMAPLLFHPFFASMAATIMGGPLIATALTLVVVPVFYSLFFRISRDEMRF